MTDYSLVGAHLINKWLWSQLQATGWFDDYAPTGSLKLTPIIPAQQQPEFINIIGGAPFIVYNYTHATTPYWWLKAEQCAYQIYDNDEGRLRNIQNYMNDLLIRDDWTAQDVNNFIWTDNPEFEFKTMTVTSFASPGAYSEPGGRQGAMLVVRYEYTRDMNNRGMRV